MCIHKLKLYHCSNSVLQHQKSWNVASRESEHDSESNEDSPPCSESELLMANSRDTDILSGISVIISLRLFHTHSELVEKKKLKCL